jgi:dihydrofolate reductase
MRKVVVSVYVTLNGIMEAPEKWSGQFWNAEHGRYARELLFASDALLMGRETYEIFAASWPNRTAADDGPGSEGFVDRINSLPKFVASTTLKEPLTWNNSHLIKENVAEAVSKLKQQPGQDIVMYGAGPVAHTLMQHGLIDELRVWVHPIVWGSGKHLFNNASDVPVLRLVGTTTFSSGVIVLAYQPDGKT